MPMALGWRPSRRDLHRIRDLLVHPARTLGALVGFEQDASVGELAGWGGARGDQALQIVSFGFAEDYGIFLLDNGRSVPAVSFFNQIKRNGLVGEGRGF
jgi:hypothetical protein